MSWLTFDVWPLHSITCYHVVLASTLWKLQKWEREAWNLNFWRCQWECVWVCLCVSVCECVYYVCLRDWVCVWVCESESNAIMSVQPKLSAIFSPKFTCEVERSASIKVANKIVFHFPHLYFFRSNNWFQVLLRCWVKPLQPMVHACYGNCVVESWHFSKLKENVRHYDNPWLFNNNDINNNPTMVDDHWRSLKWRSLKIVEDRW